MTRTHRGLLAALLATLVLAAASPATAGVDLCQKGIQKAGGKLQKLLLKNLQKCADGYRKGIIKSTPLPDVAAACQTQLAKTIPFPAGDSAFASAATALTALTSLGLCTDGDLLALGHLPTDPFGDRWQRWMLIARLNDAYTKLNEVEQDLPDVFAAMAAAGGCPLCSKLATPPCFRQSCGLGPGSGAKAYAPALFSIALTGETVVDVCRYDDVLPNEYAMIGGAARSIAQTLLLGTNVCTRVVGTEGYISCAGSTAPRVSYTACQDHLVSAPDIDECAGTGVTCTPNAADPIPEHAGGENGGTCVSFSSASPASGSAFALVTVEITFVDAAHLGPDLLACTGDDTGPAPMVVTVPLTTSTAQSFFYDAAATAGNTITPPSVVGAPFTCANVPTGSLAGAQLVGGAPALHQLCLFPPCDDPNTPADEGNVPIDAVATFTLVCQ